MALRFSMYFKVVATAASFLRAASLPGEEPRKLLRASALETGHHSVQSPFQTDAVDSAADSALGAVPDLAPIPGGAATLASSEDAPVTPSATGVSAAMNGIPGLANFLKQEKAKAVSTVGAKKRRFGSFKRANQLPANPGVAFTPMAGGAYIPVAPAPAPAVAAGPSAAREPDLEQFLPRVAELLTCQDLEDLVQQKCGRNALYKAIFQFEGNAMLCGKAIEKIVELHDLFKEYFGPMADCNTEMHSWRFNGFVSQEECEFRTRERDFKVACRLI